jgi:O-antigen ligase
VAHFKQLLVFDNRINLGLLAWIAVFFSILMWTRSELRAGELGDTKNYYRIVLVLAAAGAALWTLMRNGERLSRAFPGPLGLLLVYGLVAMTSSLYIPAYAFYSMWKGFEIVVDVLVMAAVLSYPQPLNCARTAYRLMAFFYGVLVIVYLLEAVLMPSQALSPTRGYISIYMMGVLPVMAQNGLAFLSAVVAFAIICRLHRPGRLLSKSFYLLILCLSLMTLIFAQSRTSIAGLVLAVLLFLLVDRRFISLTLVLATCLLAAIYTQASDVSFQYLLRGQDTELVTTLSGRTEGWRAAWEAFQESPIAGYGFAAFARANILGTSEASSLHGAVFDVIVGTGLLGFIPWAAAIVWTLVRLATLPLSGDSWFRSPIGRSIQAEMVGVAALIIVRASTSSGLAMHEDNFMLFLTLLAYTFAMRDAVRRGPRQQAAPAMTGAIGVDSNPSRESRIQP